MTHITPESLWRVLVKRYDLTAAQEQQFRSYAHELLSWNQHINLTGYSHMSEVVEMHFDDALTLSMHRDLTQCTSLCDVGAGAGLPGLALKIKFPHLQLLLIEVNHKKVTFLEHMIQLLQLEHVQVCALDWRTFLRTTEINIDLFCSRAAVDPEELVRMFKPSCGYNQAQMVYWAAEAWQPQKHVAPFVQQEYTYHIAGRKRRLIVFGKPNKEKDEQNDLD